MPPLLEPRHPLRLLSLCLQRRVLLRLQGRRRCSRTLSNGGGRVVRSATARPLHDPSGEGCVAPCRRVHVLLPPRRRWRPLLPVGGTACCPCCVAAAGRRCLWVQLLAQKESWPEAAAAGLACCGFGRMRSGGAAGCRGFPRCSCRRCGRRSCLVPCRRGRSRSCLVHFKLLHAPHEGLKRISRLSSLRCCIIIVTGVGSSSAACGPTAGCCCRLLPAGWRGCSGGSRRGGRAGPIPVQVLTELLPDVHHLLALPKKGCRPRQVEGRGGGAYWEVAGGPWWAFTRCPPPACPPANCQARGEEGRWEAAEGQGCGPAGRRTGLWRGWQQHGQQRREDDWATTERPKPLLPWRPPLCRPRQPLRPPACPTEPPAAAAPPSARPAAQVSGPRPAAPAAAPPPAALAQRQPAACCWRRKHPPAPAAAAVAAAAAVLAAPRALPVLPAPAPVAALPLPSAAAPASRRRCRAAAPQSWRVRHRLQAADQPTPSRCPAAARGRRR